jgi:glycosyltransferase involved in cell wall biosynthesis
MAASIERLPAQPADSQPANESQESAVVSVLHVINGEHYSGAERVQDLLAGNLGEFGFRVGFACLKPGRFPEMRENTAAPIHEMSMRWRFDPRPVWQLVKIIRREGYQLVHAHTPRSLMLAAVASLITGVKLVYHVHSPAANDSDKSWQNRVNALVERICLLWASAVIAVSRSLGNRMCQSGISAARLSVVPNGVPVRQPKCSRRAGDRENWTLGTVALFRPRKGTEVLLKSLALQRSEGLPVRLRAVGPFETPEYERQIKQLADELGLTDAIDWIGFTQDVESELAQMDLFVLPSLFGEGLPMVVLEAMASGVPVVATRVEGVPEAVRDGQDGLIAEPGDARSLADAIARVVRGDVDWREMGSNAMARQAEEFSDRSMARGVAQVYRRVLERRFGTKKAHSVVVTAR